MATSRKWIDHEEDVMLTIFEEMVADGVRCVIDSFKASTFVMVASKMREHIPDINIELKHIQNKLKRLKEKYSSAYDMMNTFGFGWDDEKNCVMDSDKYYRSGRSKGGNKAVTEMKKLGESFTFKEAKARLPSELQAMGLPYNQVLRISMKLVKDTDLMGIWSALDDS
ncbi:hypothetical protein C1H46_002981 [Malus baccata]|uniref:Myb/SANT-like domain-containing protein n=1 Tax=Malus baccata TaxID=106549 RepID=A0A540NK58_MALBA|nr:hypothetical protein C1H46_002981 [Malus baccata]